MGPPVEHLAELATGRPHHQTDTVVRWHRRGFALLALEVTAATAWSPWQNPFAERLIGSVRRECLNHVTVWNERSLRSYLRQYLTYYDEWRTHVSLDKDDSHVMPVGALGSREVIDVVGSNHERQ